MARRVYIMLRHILQKGILGGVGDQERWHDIHQPSLTLHSFLYSLSVVEIGHTSSSVPMSILLLSGIVLGPKIMCPN